MDEILKLKTFVLTSVRYTEDEVEIALQIIHDYLKSKQNGKN